jgi:hypothetical protein
MGGAILVFADGNIRSLGRCDLLEMALFRAHKRRHPG